MNSFARSWTNAISDIKHHNHFLAFGSWITHYRGAKTGAESDMDQATEIQEITSNGKLKHLE